MPRRNRSDAPDVADGPVRGQTGRVDATGRPPAPVRLVEVLAALALATDLGMGQPLGHAIRCALIADGLAGQLGLIPGARAEVVRVGLLRYLGCTADAAEVAAYAGDEIALAVAVAPHVMGDRAGSAPTSSAPSSSCSPPPTRTRRCARAARTGRR